MHEVRALALNRGGAQQRTRNYEAERFRAENVRSELVDFLIQRFSWGELSATMVQQIAKAASNDMENAGKGRIKEWDILGRMGSSGHNKNLIYRDLRRKLPPAALDLTQQAVPVKCSPSRGIIQHCAFQRLPLISPSHVFQKIWNLGKFDKCFLQDLSSLERFWNDVGEHPALLHHPIKKLANYKRRAIPLALHGDGAPVTQQIGSGSKSCLFISMRSLVAPSHQHFLLAAVWTHMITKGASMNTVNSVWAALSKDFLSMQTTDGATTGGFVGVLIFSTGDLEYFNQFHECAHWRSNFPCSLCSVHKDKLSDWKSVGDLSADTWSSLPRSHPCPLFRSLLSPSAICPDWMHSKHLGVDQRFLGSVVWMLVFKLSPPSSTVDASMSRLLHEMTVASFALQFVLLFCNVFEEFFVYIISFIM